MAKTLIIPVNCLRRGVLVFIGSQQELIEHIRKKYPEDLMDVVQKLADTPPATLATTIRTGTDAIIFAENMPTIPTFIHEAYHAAFGLLAIIGADTSDEEIYAYLTEYICTRIFDWLNIPCDVPSQ